MGSFEASKPPFLTFILSNRGAEPVRQLARVVVRPEMHEEEVRAVGQHVAVKGRDGDAVARRARITAFTSFPT